MTGKTFTVTRQIASKRFTPKKTPAQRAFEFIEQQATLSNVPYLDANYAIKAARPKTQRARNAASDNKEPRKKAAGPNKRFGVLVFNPKEKWAPGKVFIPYVRRTGRNGKSDDIPNWGWITEPTILKYDDIPAVIQQHMLGLYKKPRVKFRDGFRNPKTGQLGTKALGPTLSEIRRGAGGLANIARGVTRGLGLVEDALGRLRCPPGVPAAMQFTDDMGSNCFGISAGDVVKATRQALKARREIMEGLDDVQKAYGRIRSLRSGSRTIGGEGSVVPRVPSTEAELEALADAAGIAREIKPNIIESPGTPVLIRNDGTISPTAILPENYEDDVRAALRFLFPEATNVDIEKKVALAKARYAMVQAVNGRIQLVMMKLKEMGIEIDATDPISVSAGLLRGFLMLQESGDINFDPLDFYRYLGIDALPEGATPEEVVRFAHARVAELIANKFFNIDPKGRAIVDGPARYEDYMSEDEVKLLLEYISEATDKFGGENVELKVRRDFVRYALGELDLTDFDERLHPALKAFKAQFTAYQTHEQGLMIGLQFMHHENPGVLQSLSRVEAVNPFSPGWETGDAEVMPDTISGDDMKVIMRWNPVGTIFTTSQAGIRRGEYRLYESDGRGLAVEQLVEIGRAADTAARKQLLDAFMKPFGDTYEDVFNPDTPSFLKEIYDEHVGIMGKSMWIIEHEMTHVRQIELAYRILGTNASGERIHTLTNEELAMLVHQSLTGASPLFDSSYIFENPKFSSKLAALAINMDAMNENGIVGQYARGHYLAALELESMFEMTPERRHAHLESLYKEIAELQSAQQSKIITPEQEIRLNALGLVVQQLSAVSADGVDEFFSNKTFYDHVRMQTSINFLESTAELHAGRRMGLIPDTPEVRTALEYLDLDASELKAKIDIHKVEQNKLDEFVSKVVTELLPDVDVDELAEQARLSREMAEEAKRRINDINNGRTEPGTGGRRNTLSRIGRMIEAGALTKSDAEEYIDRANSRLFGNVDGSEQRYSRGYLSPVRNWIEKNIGKSDLRDFTAEDQQKLVQYLQIEGPAGDLKILNQYPGWDNRNSWETIKSKLSGSCANDADPEVNECRRVQNAKNRMDQYSRLITIIADVEEIKKYKDKAPTVRPPGKNIDPQSGKEWEIPKIQSQSRPRGVAMRSAGRSVMTAERTVGVPSRANQQTVQQLRATTKRFDTSDSLHKYGIRSRERSSEIANISERRAIEQELPEKNNARLPLSDIGLRTELSMSASRRQSGGKTLDKKIKEDIIPIMTLIDKSQIPDDVAVAYALPESVHGALKPGSKLKFNNITRARIIDEEAKGIRSSSRKTQRMILRVPGGSRGVFDHDYTGKPGYRRGQMTAVLMPPGEVEIIDRLQDGTVIGELKNQQTSQSVLGDIISRLSQIADRRSSGSSDSRRYEARNARRVAEQYRDTVMNIQQALPQRISGYRSSSRPNSSSRSIETPQMDSADASPPDMSARPDDLMKITFDTDSFKTELETKVSKLLDKYVPDSKNKNFEAYGDELMAKMGLPPTNRTASKMLDMGMKDLQRRLPQTVVEFRDRETALDDAHFALRTKSADKLQNILDSIQTEEGQKAIREEMGKGFVKALAGIELMMQENDSLRGRFTFEIHAEGDNRPGDCAGYAYIGVYDDGRVIPAQRLVSQSLIFDKEGIAGGGVSAGDMYAATTRIVGVDDYQINIAIHETAHNMHYVENLRRLGIDCAVDSKPVVDQLKSKGEKLGDTYMGALYAMKYGIDIGTKWDDLERMWDDDKTIKEIWGWEGKYNKERGTGMKKHVAKFASMEAHRMHQDGSGILFDSSHLARTEHTDSPKAEFFAAALMALRDNEPSRLDRFKDDGRLKDLGSIRSQIEAALDGQTIEQFFEEGMKRLGDVLGFDTARVNAGGLTHRTIMETLGQSSIYGKTNPWEAVAEAKTLEMMAKSFPNTKILDDVKYDELKRNLETVIPSGESKFKSTIMTPEAIAWVRQFQDVIKRMPEFEIREDSTA